MNRKAGEKVLIVGMCRVSYQKTSIDVDYFFEFLCGIEECQFLNAF